MSDDADQAREGFNRRDFLRLGAYVGAVSAGLGGIGSGLANAAPPPGELLTSFRVEIPGMPQTSINVQSVQIEDLTVDVRETGVEGGFRTYAPGDAHYGKATFIVRASTGNSEPQQWIADASAGRNVRKTISIVLHDRAGSEARRYNLYECFPVRFGVIDWQNDQLQTLKWVLEVRVQRIDLQ